VACASLRYRSTRLNVVGVESKGSKRNLKNLECILIKKMLDEKAHFIFSKFKINNFLLLAPRLFWTPHPTPAPSLWKSIPTNDDFYFPDRGSLGMGQKFGFGILVDLHVLRSTESKKVAFTKCLSSVRANKDDSYGPIQVKLRNWAVIDI